MEEIRRIPGVHQRNTFAKLIEEIYGNDFKFNKNWIKKDSKFKEIIFDKNGKLAKYLLDYIKKVIVSEDYEEMERLLEINNSLLILKKKKTRIVLKENVKKFLFKRSSFKIILNIFKIVESFRIYIH